MLSPRLPMSTLPVPSKLLPWGLLVHHSLLFISTRVINHPSGLFWSIDFSFASKITAHSGSPISSTSTSPSRLSSASPSALPNSNPISGWNWSKNQISSFRNWLSNLQVACTPELDPKSKAIFENFNCLRLTFRARAIPPTDGFWSANQSFDILHLSYHTSGSFYLWPSTSWQHLQIYAILGLFSEVVLLMLWFGAYGYLLSNLDEWLSSAPSLLQTISSQWLDARLHDFCN